MSSKGTGHKGQALRVDWKCTMVWHVTTIALYILDRSLLLKSFDTSRQ